MPSQSYRRALRANHTADTTSLQALRPRISDLSKSIRVDPDTATNEELLTAAATLKECEARLGDARRDLVDVLVNQRQEKGVRVAERLGVGKESVRQVSDQRLGTESDSLKGWVPRAERIDWLMDNLPDDIPDGTSRSQEFLDRFVSRCCRRTDEAQSSKVMARDLAVMHQQGLVHRLRVRKRFYDYARAPQATGPDDEDFRTCVLCGRTGSTQYVQDDLGRDVCRVEDTCAERVRANLREHSKYKKRTCVRCGREGVAAFLPADDDPSHDTWVCSSATRCAKREGLRKRRPQRDVRRRIS